MFLYAFDTLGIIYTVVSSALIIMLLAAVISIAVKRKPCTKGTVFFRVIDIVICTVLLGAWVLFALTYLIVLPVQLIGIALIWASGLGIMFISVVTALAITSLVLSFVLRRKASVPARVLKPAPVLPAEGKNMLFELMADLDNEEKTNEPITENKPQTVSAHKKTASPNALAEIKIETRKETASKKKDEPFGIVAPKLPTMRKVVIEKRGDATNMFNNYLSEKESKERETLENSIDEITIK